MMQILTGTSLTAKRAQFQTLALRICDLVLVEGILARPWSHPSLPFFSQLSPSAQDQLLHYFEIYILILSRLSREGVDISKATRRLTTDFLKEARLEPAHDLLEHLEDGEYLAAYNETLQMVFLTPNHLKLMSYSLEDLYCRPWPLLFQRTEEIEKILVNRALEFARGSNPKTYVHTDLPPHMLVEINSPELRSATCYPKAYSPIFKKGRPAGFVAINNGKPASTRVFSN